MSPAHALALVIGRNTSSRTLDKGQPTSRHPEAQIRLKDSGLSCI